MRCGKCLHHTANSQCCPLRCSERPCFRRRSGGKFGGNHSDLQRISAAASEPLPEHVSIVASHSGCQRTIVNSVWEAAA